MLTKAALDRLQLTAIAKVSYIVRDFEEAFEQEELMEFPYQEISDAEILRQNAGAGVPQATNQGLQQPD